MTRATRTLAAGLILGWSLGMAAPASAQHARVITLMVLVDDHASVRAGILEQAKADATRVFQDIDVHIVWLVDSDARLEDTAVLTSAVVVHILTPEMTARRNAPGGVLGLVASGTRLAAVFYSRIEGLSPRNDSDTSSLLGHVLAHEIGHLLLPANAHSRSGIMQAVLTTKLVSGPGLFFTADQAQLIRTRLAGF